MTATTPAKTMESVFLNYPFDDEYLPLLDAMLFAILACGLRPRCASEYGDGGEVRIEKLYSLIGECRFAVHDLSRVELTEESKLPRFNMPLELGIWLGAKRFGSKQKNKVCLILDSQQHRHPKFISDISGQDAISHGNDPLKLVRAVRDWLQPYLTLGSKLPGGSHYVTLYEQFCKVRPKLATEARRLVSELTFRDRVQLIEVWLVNTASSAMS